MSSHRRLTVMRWFWRTFNPLVMRLARWSAIWGVLETRGRKSGLPRSAPVAIGRDGKTVWIVAAQGEKAAYVRNIAADTSVRICIRGRWYTGRADLLPSGAPFAPALGWYARSAARLWPDEYRIVRVDLD
jgi:deazaflavin-dependent oxidoreductase (nitroreductase family)